MIIESIELENFGPFVGIHRIELGGKDRPVTLVYGENMSGKTSILNAIRWGLYGRAYDRGKNVMPTRKLVNRDALEGGQRRVSVQLQIRSSNEGAESSYLLKRLHQARPNHPNPRYEEDFEEFLSVEKDGVIHAAGDFADVVAQILPFGISRFFLFDGEMLDEYETLVAEQSEAAGRKVREDIKAILGVPAVVLGRDDMATVKAEFGRKLLREAKLDKALEDATRDAEQWEAKKAAYRDDLRDSQQQLKTHETQLAQVEAELDQIGDLKEDMGQLKQLRVDRDEAKRDLQSMLEERRKLTKELWRDVLVPRTSAALERFRSERVTLQQTITERSQLEKRVADLKSALSDTRICPLCGQKVTPENLKEVRTEFHKAELALQGLPVIDQGRLDALSALVDGLQQASTERVAPLIEKVETEISKQKIAIYKKSQDIDKIEERLAGINEEKADENLRIRKDTE